MGDRMTEVTTTPETGSPAESMSAGCGLELLRRRAQRLGGKLELRFAPSGYVELRLLMSLD